MIFRIRPKHVAFSMLGCITFLLIAHLIGRYLRFGLGHDYVYGLIPFFNLNEEDNLPSLYSGLTLIFSSLLFCLIGLTRRSERESFSWHWLGLSVAFLFVAFDELFYFHERLDTLLRNKFHTHGVFFYAWIVPYSIITIAIGVAYLRFFLALSKRYRILFFSSAALFFSGAVGVESLGGAIADTKGVMNFTYIACATVEELLEMLGIALLVYGLLSYIETHWGSLIIDFRKPQN